jgi:hypothetical protein
VMYILQATEILSWRHRLRRHGQSGCIRSRKVLQRFCRKGWIQRSWNVEFEGWWCCGRL